MSTYNAKSPSIKRIMKEAAELSSCPSPDYTASPISDTNLFDWHFTLRGPPSSPFAGGIYHGRIVLPAQYPLRPPSFRFLTPSGRFEVNREICLSISGHHEETWQPAWGVRTALVALRSFMESDARGQLGGVESSEGTRRRLAGESRAWRCGGCGGKSCEEILGEVEREWEGGNGEGGGREREVEKVPEGMQFAFKKEEGGEKDKSEDKDNEVGKGKEKESKNANDPAEINQNSPVNPLTSASTPESSTTNSYPPARPGQSVPTPTSTIPIQQPQLQTQPQVQRQTTHDVSNNGVPIWVDRAIMGIVIALVFMVVKMLVFGR